MTTSLYFDSMPRRRLLILLAAIATIAGPASAQIQEVWSRTYVGAFTGLASSLADPFSDVALDGQGNVHVAGSENGDFVTVKYSADGTLVWSNRFDGGASETAMTAAASAAGEVWVSGVSLPAGGPPGFGLLVKYDATGHLAWSRRYQSNVLSSAVVVDGAGDAWMGGSLSGGSLYVVKYSADGSELWAKTYLPASAAGWYFSLGGLALDGLGNVVVAGLSTDPTTFARRNVLVKFDPAGNLLWGNEALPYAGGGTPSAMTPDSAGGVYFSGDSILAGKVGPDGTLSWTRARSGSLPTFSAVRVDPAGNLVVAGTDTFYRKLCSDCGDSAYDYYLFRATLDSNGNILRPERSYKDYGFGRMQFDADGSCYLAGSFSSFSDDPLPPHPDGILVKFAPNGAELWRTNFSMGFMAGMKVDGAGNVYLIAGGTASVTIRKFSQPQGAPTFSLQPQSRSALDGDDIRFTAGGSGYPSPVFQWLFNGSALADETNDTLLLPSARTSQAGQYSLTLSNSLGTATSAVATLTIDLLAPSVTAEITPVATQFLAGANVTLCAQAFGGPKPALQWHFNGAILPGETNTCLALHAVQPADGGVYTVTASNFLGVASASAPLTVIPLILQGEGSTQALAVGSCLYLSSSVGLTSQYSLQWLFNDQPLIGENNGWLDRCPVGTNDGGLYSLVVNTSLGSYTSGPVRVTVHFSPPTGAQPVLVSGRAEALVGQDVALDAIYAGSPSFVQWRRNGADLAGETNATLPLLAITTNMAGQYSFTAINPAGATTSSVLTVTVSYQPPIFAWQPASQSVVEGTTTRFPADAPAGPPAVYYLERSGTNVPAPYIYQSTFYPPGSFNLFDTTFADAGSYRIVASNSLGSATSAVVTLTVTAAGPLDRWTLRNPLPQSEAMLSVAHGAGLFVGVGEGGTIMTSPNGTNWTLQNRRADLALNGVAFGQGTFVAVGDGGTILSSSDGSNWAYRYAAALTPLHAVAHGAGRFVAVGSAPGVSTFVLTSTNGVDWQRIPLNGPSSERCVTYGNGLFVAAGSSSIIVSTNGTDWKTALNVGTQIEGILFADSRYIAVGDNGTVLVSTDGLSWEARAPVTSRRLLGVAYGAGRFVASGARGVLITSTDTMTWSGVSSGTPDRMETVDFFDGKFVVAGENGTILTSTNGTDWIRRNFGVTRDFDGMSVANGLAVVVGKGGNILTSTNGVNYLVENSGVTNDLHGVSWGAGLWVAVGEPGIILTSPNARAWTSRNSGTSNSLKDVTYASGQWIAVGTQGTIVRSTDGESWTTRYTNPPYDLNAVAQGNGLFMIAGDGLFGENGSAFKSSDGLAWSQVLEFSGSKNLRGVTFADGQFLFAANDGYVFTTRDGSAFLAHGAADRFASVENLRAVNRINGLWIVVGNHGTIATSTDTVTWTSRASRSFENLHRVAWLDGRWITIGNRGNILQSGRLDLKLEPPQFAPGAGFHLPFEGVLDRAYQIQASSNFVDWINLLTFTNRSEHGEFTDTNALRLPRRFYRFMEQ